MTDPFKYSYGRGIPLPKFESKDDFFKKLARDRRADRKEAPLSVEMLMASYELLVANGNTQRLPLYNARNIVERVLKRIRSGNYAPDKPTQKKIPKSKGGFRTISKPSLPDKIVSKAVLELINDQINDQLSEQCFGTRKNGGVDACIAAAYHAIAKGHHFAGSADLKAAFDSVRTEILIGDLKSMIGDSKYFELIAVIIRGHKGLSRMQGIDQGNNVSSIGLDCHLHQTLDRHFPICEEYSYMRYCDNIFIYGPSQSRVDELLTKAVGLARGVQLELLVDPIINLHEHKSTILGYTLGITSGRIVLDLDQKRFWSDLKSGLMTNHEMENPFTRVTQIIDAIWNHLALRGSWLEVETQKLNHLLNECGYDLKVNHQQVTKRLKDLHHNWINSFKLQHFLEGYQAGS
jgi:hypothetical protein